MFEFAGEFDGANRGDRHLVDAGRDVTFRPYSNSWWERGISALFLLTIGNRSIPVQVRWEYGASEDGSSQRIHVILEGVGDTPLSRSEGLRSDAVPEESAAVRALAAEALLVFGAWFNGVEYPEGHFVIDDTLGSRWTLADVGLTGAAWQVNALPGLNRMRLMYRADSIQAAWGKDPLDAALAVVVRNAALLPFDSDADCRVDPAEVLPDVPVEERAALVETATALVGVRGRYGLAVLEGVDLATVLERAAAEHPGFSAESYLRCVSAGVALARRAAAVRPAARSARVAKARELTLLDGVFVLQEFNRRYVREDPEGQHDIHHELGDLYSRAEIDDATRRSEKLIDDGRGSDYQLSFQQDMERLRTGNPGFAEATLARARDWGMLLNR